MVAQVAVVLSVLTALILGARGIMKPAEWAAEVSSPAVWRGLHLVAGLAGASAGGYMAFAVPEGRPTLALAAASGASALTFLFVVALATDLRARKVDRVLLNLGIVLTSPFALAYLIKDQYVDLGSTTHAITAGSFFALAVFVYFFVFAIGASDARAMMLIATAALPVAGIEGMVSGVTFVSVGFIVVAVVLGIYHRSFKVSMPAVPVLLGPFLLTLLLTRF